eukprot:g41693.t1
MGITANSALSTQCSYQSCRNPHSATFSHINQPFPTHLYHCKHPNPTSSSPLKCKTIYPTTNKHHKPFDTLAAWTSTSSLP